MTSSNITHRTFNFHSLSHWLRNSLMEEPSYSSTGKNPLAPQTIILGKPQVSWWCIVWKNPWKEWLLEKAFNASHHNWNNLHWFVLNCDWHTFEQPSLISTALQLCLVENSCHLIVLNIDHVLILTELVLNGPHWPHWSLLNFNLIKLLWNTCHWCLEYWLYLEQASLICIQVWWC